MYRTILAVIMNHIAIAMFQDWLQCKAEAHFHADLNSFHRPGFEIQRGKGYIIRPFLPACFGLLPALQSKAE